MSMEFGFEILKNTRFIRKVYILNGQPYSLCQVLAVLLLVLLVLLTTLGDTCYKKWLIMTDSDRVVISLQAFMV